MELLHIANFARGSNTGGSMAIRIPFFGLLSNQSPLQGLLAHYEQIAKGIGLIEAPLKKYIADSDRSQAQDFTLLLGEVNEVEEHADTIKRYVHNHLPQGLFLPIDKQLVFRYTRKQDTILDDALGSLQWLTMRELAVPEEFQQGLLDLTDDVSKTVALLRPALESTKALLDGTGVDRSAVKDSYWDVRRQHKLVTTRSFQLNAEIYRSSLDFKDIYQLIHFVQRLQNMSHAAETCVSILRAMIAR